MAHTQTIGDYIEELEIHAGNSAAYSKYIENFYNARNALQSTRFGSPRIFERC